MTVDGLRGMDQVDLKIANIARVVHEAQRALQQITGDRVVSPTWFEAPVSQRDSCMRGVELALSGVGPAQLHAEWMEYRLAQGWKYGPVKDEWAKRHPCLVPYEDLPREQQVKDQLFVAIVRTLAEHLFTAEAA